MNHQTLLATIIALLVTPLIGGLLKGIDRKLTARMQGRIGPPILQPFYDLIKLWNKDRNVAYRSHLMWAYGYLGFIMASIVIFTMGSDILMMMFMLAFSGVCLVLGALSIKSPYSHFGGNRELMQMLAYEPILFLVALAIFLETHSFKISNIMTVPTPLLYTLPLAFIALVIVLLIKMRKSPFDISLSHHAHQEIVRGPVTEFSGKYLALVELAEWYELIIIMGLLFIFGITYINNTNVTNWISNLWLGVVIALASYFVVLVIDNISARLTWQLLLKFAWTFGIGLVIFNIFWLYFLREVLFKKII
ncbi:MAG: complex I subunit 1 family protein [Planctomycetota bacterium]